MSIAAYQGVCLTCRHDHSGPGTALASGSGDHAELARLSDRNVELSVLAYKWMEAHDALKSGQPYDYPSPADVPTLLAENAALRGANTEAERKLAEAEAYKAAWEYVFGGSDADEVRDMVSEQCTPPWPLPHHLRAMSLRPRGYDWTSKEAERG